MRVASFFAGVGSFDLAFQKAGHEVVYACEIDEDARAVYAARFGAAPVGEDIRTVKPEDIPDADIWVGGFPCVDLSTAGKRGGISMPRSGLVWSFLELASIRKPEWILFENVPGWLSGSEEVEYEPERCVCGWPRGRGGLYLDLSSWLDQQEEGEAGEAHAFLRADCEYRYDDEGARSPEVASREVGRDASHDEASDGAVGGGMGMASPGHDFGRAVLGRDLAASQDQGGTGEVGPEADGSDTRTTSFSRRSTEMASPHEAQGWSDEGDDVGVEQEGPSSEGAADSGWVGGDCPSCGRSVCEDPARSICRSWFGAVSGALAERGWDEWGYRILDAQFFGVPQRRRRVFLLARRAGAAGPRPGEVLLESEGVRGHLAARRATGTRVARAVTTRAGSVSQSDGDGDLFAVFPAEAAVACGAEASQARAQGEDHAVLGDGSSRGGAEGVPDGGPGVVPGGVTGTVQAHHGRNAPGDQLVIHDARHPKFDGNLVCGTLCASDGGSDDGDAATFRLVASTVRSHSPGVSPPGRTRGEEDNLIPFDMAQVTHPENRAACVPGSPAPTLAKTGSAHVAYAIQDARVGEKGQDGSGVGGEGAPMFTLQASVPCGVAYSVTPESGQGADLRASPCDVSPAVVGTDGAKQTDRGVRVASGVGVRRLMPVECERLQGLPDGWTDVAKVEYGEGRRAFGLRAGASDSQRYKQVGNAGAVPVLEWIARRLALLVEGRS